MEANLGGGGVQQVDAVEAPDAAMGEPRAWDGLDQIALFTVTALAFAVRLIHLSDPQEYVFDETYYAKDACWYVNASPSLCEVNSEVTMVHPPLGKWLIALGIRLFGFDSFGWRISAVVAGTITVALLYVLGRRLLGSTLAATLASGLLAIDTLHFVQSRISMLDVFVPLFGVAGVLCVVLDRQAGTGTARLRRPWLLAAGACAGLSVASKWSGVFYAALIALLAVVWEVRDSRRETERSPAVAALGVALLVVPALVYSLTYVGRLPGPDDACPGRKGAFPVRLVAQQACMIDFHQDLPQNHSYQSPAWSWPLLKRPVSYFFCSGADCDPPEAPGIYAEIFGTGSPFVWWTSFLALAFVTARWVRKRENGMVGAVVAGGFAMTYLPWLLLDLLSPRNATFLFYMLPAVPFMCLALAYVATKIGWSWEAKAAVAVFAGGAIAVFAFYYPLLTKRPIPQQDWDRRIWFFDNCEKPAASSTTTGTAGQTTATVDESLPPAGWCWI